MQYIITYTCVYILLYSSIIIYIFLKIVLVYNMWYGCTLQVSYWDFWTLHSTPSNTACLKTYLCGKLSRLTTRTAIESCPLLCIYQLYVVKTWKQIAL